MEHTIILFFYIKLQVHKKKKKWENIRKNVENRESVAKTDGCNEEKKQYNFGDIIVKKSRIYWLNARKMIYYCKESWWC